MKKKEFLEKLEELLEADTGSITGNEALEDLDGWDSLAVISFIAMVDENFGITLPAQKLADTKTVADLTALLGDRIN